MVPPVLRYASLTILAFAFTPAAASGQSLKEVLNSLFVFGEGEQPLTLAGSPGVHGMHFQAFPDAGLVDDQPPQFRFQCIGQGIGKRGE